MTKNDAYLYAKKIYRRQYSKIQIEQKMLEDGYSYEDIKLVKDWLSSWSSGRTM
ncbi:hypothetical protein vBPMCPL1_0103 [Proteus phage vB_PMC-PL1]